MRVRVENMQDSDILDTYVGPGQQVFSGDIAAVTQFNRTQRRERLDTAFHASSLQDGSVIDVAPNYGGLGFYINGPINGFASTAWTPGVDFRDGMEVARIAPHTPQWNQLLPIWWRFKDLLQRNLYQQQKVYGRPMTYAVPPTASLGEILG